MQGEAYLNGSLYHIVHLNTLMSILRSGRLLSKERVIAEKLEYYSLADEDVQKLRDRVYIQDMQKRIWRSLHSYVPFYFVEQTPLLYRKYKEGLQDEIFFLEVSRSLIDVPGVLFADGDTTIQQLSKFGTERVFLTPATRETPECKRQYHPNGPHGTNIARSTLYSGSVFLEKLNWDSMLSSDWGKDDEKKRVKHAEVLVPDEVSLDWIRAISVRTWHKARLVNELIRQYGLEGYIPGARSRPDLYF